MVNWTCTKSLKRSKLLPKGLSETFSFAAYVLEKIQFSENNTILNQVRTTFQKNCHQQKLKAF